MIDCGRHRVVADQTPRDQRRDRCGRGIPHRCRFGTRVVLLEKSGRGPQGSSASRLERLSRPRRHASRCAAIRAFIGYGKPKLSPRRLRSRRPRGARQAFAATGPSRRAIRRWPIGTTWENLKKSNRDQANHIFEKLREVGCGVKPVGGSPPTAFEFTPEEIERLAEMEHGRWNVERLFEGWRYGSPRSVRKISPYLVPWADTPTT